MNRKILHIASEVRLEKFRALTERAFHFLIQDYGYTYLGESRRYFDKPRDALVELAFAGEKVGVKVTWYIGMADVGIGLFKLDRGEFPERSSYYGASGYAPTIALDSLVKVLSKGKDSSPIPEITADISFAEMYRRADKRTTMMKNNMDSVLETLAHQLKTYGAKVLQGDISIFPKVQELHRRAWSSPHCMVKKKSSRKW